MIRLLLVTLGIIAAFALLAYLIWSIFYQGVMSRWHPDDHRQLVNYSRAYWLPWRRSDD